MTGQMPARVCGSCRQPIVWARTEKGKTMPVDPDKRPPDDMYANLAAHLDANLALHVRVLKDGQAPYGHEWRMVPHFATCPTRNPVPVTRGFDAVQTPQAKDLPAGVVAFPNATQRAARRAARSPRQ